MSASTAVADVASAMREVAAAAFDAGASASSTAPTTPQRLTAAIRIISADDTLTRSQRRKGFQLFRKEMAVADTYLALKDEADLRAEFIIDSINEI